MWQKLCEIWKNTGEKQMNILTVEGLSYYKRKHIIYQNISINLSKGDCYVIMGRDKPRGIEAEKSI